MPWPRQAAQSLEARVPRPLQPGKPHLTPLRSLPAGQGGRLGQGDPAIPHLLSAQTSLAARGVPAPRRLPAKGEVGVSAACPTETSMCGVGKGREGSQEEKVGFSGGNKQGGKGARSYSPPGQGAQWVPGFLSVPGGPVGQEHPHRVRVAPKYLPPHCSRLPPSPRAALPLGEPLPGRAVPRHSPPRPCRLCCPSVREAPSRPAAKGRR